jgi:hypothetical protein
MNDWQVMLMVWLSGIYLGWMLGRMKRREK